MWFLRPLSVPETRQGIGEKCKHESLTPIHSIFFFCLWFCGSLAHDSVCGAIYLDLCNTGLWVVTMNYMYLLFCVSDVINPMSGRQRHPPTGSNPDTQVRSREQNVETVYPGKHFVSFQLLVFFLIGWIFPF